VKAYTYTPESIGWQQWPEGLLQLAGTTPTEDPDEADVFICPGGLHHFSRASELDIFRYIDRYPEKHVFFHCSDAEVLYKRQCLFIRCNLHDRILASDRNSIAWPWPVDDFSDCVDVPANGFKYDISFHGQISSSAARKQSSEACKRMNGDIRQYKDFTGSILHTSEGQRRNREYRRSLQESRLALCPEAILGHFPYRFWEAMSAGRVPVLVGSGFVFPFEAQIPYSDFVIHVPRNQAAQSDGIALDFLLTHTDAQIIEKGMQARLYWEKYLNRVNWHRTMSEAVAGKLHRWS